MKTTNTSIIVPLYNKKEYIVAAIESVRTQSCQPLEIIVIDDGSTDGGLELVQDYSRKNGLGIITSANRRSKGVSGARNTGVQLSRGDYVAFLDSDDLWLPDHLKRMSNSMARMRWDVISSNFDFFGVKELCDLNSVFFDRLKKGILKNGFEQVGLNHYRSDNRLFQAALLGGFSFRIQASLVRKKVFWDNDIWFDENLSYLEDHQFYLDCAYKRVPMAYVDEIGVMIRKYRDDSHYNEEESHRYRMHKMIRTFDRGSMSAEERDIFDRTTHDMGFYLIRGKNLPRNVFLRVFESLVFLSQFPTNRGLREAVKNVVGTMPARFMVSVLKGKPLDPAYMHYSMDKARFH